MSRLTPEEFAEKQARNLKMSIPDIKAGIERVAIAPGIQAAAKKDKMRANLMASIDDGTWEKRVKAVTLEDWKKKAIDKGLNNISVGIDAAKEKVVKFATVLLPHVDSGQAKVKRMPDATLADSGQRMLTFMNHMAELKYKKR